jgi:hypothetical protein
MPNGGFFFCNLIRLGGSRTLRLLRTPISAFQAFLSWGNSWGLIVTMQQANGAWTKPESASVPTTGGVHSRGFAVGRSGDGKLEVFYLRDDLQKTHDHIGRQRRGRPNF